MEYIYIRIISIYFASIFFFCIINNFFICFFLRFWNIVFINNCFMLWNESAYLWNHSLSFFLSFIQYQMCLCFRQQQQKNNFFFFVYTELKIISFSNEFEFFLQNGRFIDANDSIYSYPEHSNGSTIQSWEINSLLLFSKKYGTILS